MLNHTSQIILSLPTLNCRRRMEENQDRHRYVHVWNLHSHKCMFRVHHNHWYTKETSVHYLVDAKWRRCGCAVRSSDLWTWIGRSCCWICRKGAPQWTLKMSSIKESSSNWKQLTMLSSWNPKMSRRSSKRAVGDGYDVVGRGRWCWEDGWVGMGCDWWTWRWMGGEVCNTTVLLIFRSIDYNDISTGIPDTLVTIENNEIWSWNDDFTVFDHRWRHYEAVFVLRWTPDNIKNTGFH